MSYKQLFDSMDGHLQAGDQSRRYYTVWTESKAVDPGGDTAALVRSMTVPTQPHPSHRLRLFTPPQTDQQQVIKRHLMFWPDYRS